MYNCVLCLRLDNEVVVSSSQALEVRRQHLVNWVALTQCVVCVSEEHLGNGVCVDKVMDVDGVVSKGRVEVHFGQRPPEERRTRCVNKRGGCKTTNTTKTMNRLAIMKGDLQICSKENHS